MISFCAIDPSLIDIGSRAGGTRDVTLKNNIKKLIARIFDRHVVCLPCDAPDNKYPLKEKVRTFEAVAAQIGNKIYYQHPNISYVIQKAFNCEWDVEFRSSEEMREFFVVASSNVVSVAFCSEITMQKIKEIADRGSNDAAHILSKAVVFSIENNKINIAGSLAACETCAFLFSGYNREDGCSGYTLAINLHSIKLDKFIERVLRPLSQIYKHILWYEKQNFVAHGGQIKNSPPQFMELEPEKVLFAQQLLKLDKCHLSIIGSCWVANHSNNQSQIDRQCHESTASRLSVDICTRLACINVQPPSGWHDRVLVLMDPGAAGKDIASHLILVFSAPLAVRNEGLRPGTCVFRSAHDDEVQSTERIDFLLKKLSSRCKPTGPTCDIN